MKNKDQIINSIPDLLRALQKHRPAKESVWYRGQEDRKWPLIPSLARTPRGISCELMLLKRFKQNALAFLTHRPQTEWEWAFVMQHHGVPTRLLDWTESPLVGAYFAVSGSPKADGALWALLPRLLNESAGIVPEIPSDIPGFDDDIGLRPYLPTQLAAERTSHNNPVAAIAPRNTARIQAQLGVFTITHRDQIAIENVKDGKHVWRYIIPSSSKPKLLEELEHLHITKLSLFPELQNVGMHVRNLSK